MHRRIQVTLIQAIMSAGCAAIFTIALPSVSNATNILIDPGAELQTSTPNPATAYGQGWALFNGAGFSMDVARTGSWSIKNAGGGGFSVPGDYQQFAASPGEAWTMTGFALTPATILAGTDFGQLQITFTSGPNGTGANLGTVETSPGNALGSNHIDPTSPAGTWLPLSVTAHAPAGTQSVQLYTIVIDQNKTSVYFDDLGASATPEPCSLVLSGLGLVGLLALRRRVSH
jgi:hypothetical protein